MLIRLGRLKLNLELRFMRRLRERSLYNLKSRVRLKEVEIKRGISLILKINDLFKLWNQVCIPSVGSKTI